MYLYSLFDFKAQQFTPPFLANSDEEAKRIVALTVRGAANTLLAQYPADFTLFRLAEWDAGAGKVSPLEVRESLDTVLQIVSELLKSAKPLPANDVPADGQDLMERVQ